jgi:ribonuclease T1
MATAASRGRQGYRGLVLLVAAVLLLIWFFTPAGQDDRPSSGSGATSSESESEAGSGSAEPTTFPSTPPASQGTDRESGLPLVEVSALPAAAARTLELIDAGGPFPEPEHDGGTFQNREELLPERPMGYYREYTVPTPGSDDRGARRVVAGEEGERYWTGDHYSSFSRIVWPG